MEQFISKQLNESLNGELNNLFERWKDSYQDENINDKFCLDGLVVKYKNEESGYDINQKWLESKRKIMFILKDCPNGWSYDARRLLVGYENDDKSLKNAIKTRNLKGSTGFFKNIALLLYGLYNLTEENKGKEEISWQDPYLESSSASPPGENPTGRASASSSTAARQDFL